MDVLGVNNNNPVIKSRRQGRIRDKKEIKVTYISSPMKVKTKASNFRALVQELTGQDSNVAEAFVQEGALNSYDGADRENVHCKASSTQQWQDGGGGGVVDGGYIPQQASWLKPDYTNYHQLHSTLEPLNQSLQYDLLSFDML